MKLLGGEEGFTLIELVVTGTVMAIAFVAVIQLFINIGDLNRRSRSLAQATEIAQQKIEADRNLGYTAIPASEDFSSQLTASEFGAPRTATATYHDLSPALDGLKQLDIAISYKDSSGHTQNVQISTLIGKRGIDK